MLPKMQYVQVGWSAMRLEWLEDILAVAETGSFSEAAERRHLTQSAFSRRIRHIEDYVGVDLFDRTKKPVQLRPTTQAQREEMARLAQGLRQVMADLRRGDRVAGNRVVIACQHALTAAPAPSLIRSFQAVNDAAFVRLRSANLDECFGLLLSRQADVSVVYRLPGTAHPVDEDYVETLVLGQDRLVPVRAPGAGTMAYVAYPREVFLGAVMAQHIVPRLTAAAVAKVETALTMAALEFAVEGLGVAWVPASLAAARIAEARLVDLSEELPFVELEITAVRLAGSQGAAAGAFWQHLGG